MQENKSFQSNKVLYYAVPLVFIAKIKLTYTKTHHHSLLFAEIIRQQTENKLIDGFGFGQVVIEGK